MASDEQGDADWLRSIKGLPASVNGQVIQKHRKYYELWPGDEERLLSIAARLEQLEAENQRLWMVIDELIDAVALAAPDGYQDLIDKARAALQPAPEGWEKV